MTLRKVIATSLFLISLCIAVNEAKSKYCGEALAKYLPDSSVSSSSAIYFYENNYGKIDGKRIGGWIPLRSDHHPYLEFDLGGLYLICGFEVKGCAVWTDRWEYSFVKRYRAQVSPEKEYWDSWNYVKPELYGGNTGKEKAYSTAQERKVGRYVRIFPVDYEPFSNALSEEKGISLCMKAEVYGIPYLSYGQDVFTLGVMAAAMRYDNIYKVDQVGADYVTLRSKSGYKFSRVKIDGSNYGMYIPHHVPLKTELRVDACVLAPYPITDGPDERMSARVEKANPETDEYFILYLFDIGRIGVKAKKYKREQLQVVFSAWCKEIGDHFEVLYGQMCLGKIVQLDSDLVFKADYLGFFELHRYSYRDREEKEFVSNKRVDEVKHGRFNVMYYKNYKTKCDIATGSAKYNMDALSYVVDREANIKRKPHELWYRALAKGPDFCKPKNVEKFKCSKSRIPFTVTRLNCPTLQVWNGVKCEDEDECKTGMAACGLHASCENSKAGYKCYCPRPGFRKRDAHREDCQDIDECKKRYTCDRQASCKNTLGSYTCHCKKGYKGDGRTCRDIDECKVSANMKDCEKHNSFCKNFRGGYQCECKPGFHGKFPHCKDLDECTSSKHDCSPYARCTNTIGSFKCECKEGFHGNGRNCEDKKECNEPLKNRSCHAHGRCVDTFGGYECECIEGYHGDGIKSCVRTNECELGIHKCHKTWATCVDTLKSYDCHCNKGFEGDGRNCQDIDECARNKHNCSAPNKNWCINNPGSYYCICSSGFTGDGKTGNCVDIDECKEGFFCDKYAICVNTVGDFNCTRCRTGFWGDAKKRCEPKTKCMEKLPYCDLPRAVCKTTEKSRSSPAKHDCFCKPGFTGNNSNCIDIDECLHNDSCSKDANCTNAVGGFLCRCKEGFVGNGFNCSDVDECTQHRICEHGQKCTNTFGSYDCSCKKGFYPTDAKKNKCKDIDECLDNDSCSKDANCTNTVGGFLCRCKEGFEGNGFNCSDVDECTQHRICGHGQKCTNTFGSYDCSCKKGFYLTDAKKNKCKDADECNSDKWPCAEEATCNNNEGGYSCACPKGYLGDGKYLCEVDNSSPSHGATKGWTLLVAMVTLLLISTAF